MTAPYRLHITPLEVEGALNVRDLGGLPLEDGGWTRPLRLIRSDSPHVLTDAGVAALAGYGVRVVIDLRAESERMRAPSRLEQMQAMHCIAAPVFADGDPVPTPRLTAPADVYSWWLSNRQTRLASVLAAVADAEAAPVLVHCHAGKDRTGVVVALLLRVAGVPADVVADDYAQSSAGLRTVMEAERRFRLARGDDPTVVERTVAITRETMLDTLGHLDHRHGGVLAYITSLGLGTRRFERLKGLLRDEAWP